MDNVKKVRGRPFPKGIYQGHGFKKGVYVGHGFKKGVAPAQHKDGCKCMRCSPMTFEKRMPLPKIPWNKGIPITEKQRLILSKANSERPRTLEERIKKSNALLGSKSPHWKGGPSKLSKSLRGHSLMNDWRKKVFRRDNYTCQKCGIRNGKIHAHHKVHFSKIYDGFIQKYNQFSQHEDYETLYRIADSYEPFWDLDNGETLCDMCHKEVHNWMWIGDYRKKDIIAKVEIK